MDISIIKSYLVELGFTVDHPQLTAFNDALRKTAAQVEKFTTGTFGIAGMFVKAGVAITTTLTSIAGATVGLMDHVAASDLGFQVMARRMFLGVDAAKSLKIATDALGYSLEDVIWGPKELRERFGVLMSDQKTMQAGLGPDFEKQMRAIRDIRFEFTRLEVAAQYFVMNLVGSLSRRLFGNQDVLSLLKDKVDWLIKNLPQLADQAASYIVPVMKDVWRILEDIYDVGKRVASGLIQVFGAAYDDERLKKGTLSIQNFGLVLDHVADTMAKIFGFFVKISDWFDKHPQIGIWLNQNNWAAAGRDNHNDIVSFVNKFIPSFIKKKEAQSAIVAMARQMGLDPAAALAIAGKESDFNQSAIGDGGQAVGMFQLHEGAARMGGISDRSDAGENIKGGVGYLLYLYKKYRGDWMKIFEAYNGGEGNVDRGTVSGAARGYAQDALQGMSRWQKEMGGSVNPTSYSGGVNVGGITIHITEPGANAEKIHRTVVKAIDEKMGRQTQRGIVQLGTAVV